jgi:hypothetical protein
VAADILAEVIGAEAAAGATTIVDAGAEEEVFTMTATASASAAALTIVVAGAANEKTANEEIDIPQTRTVCFIENPVMSASFYQNELGMSPCSGLNKLPASHQCRQQKICLRHLSHHQLLRLDPSPVDNLQMPTSNH